MNCSDINSLDMIRVLEELGYKYESKSNNEYKYQATYRNDRNPSLSVNPIKGEWFDFGIGTGGKLVDLLMLILKVESVKEVIKYCKNRFDYLFSFSQQNTSLQKEKKKSYTINNIFKPIRDNRLISYLSGRSISRNSWEKYLVEIHYENQFGKFVAIGFKNDKGGYEIDNKLMKKPFSLGPKAITTIPGSLENVCVFEGYMDFLSFVELDLHTGQTIIVLNTTAKSEDGISQLIDLCPEALIETYFDNDDGGIIATQKFRKIFKSFKSQRKLYTGYNDLNKFLTDDPETIRFLKSKRHGPSNGRSL